MANHPEVNYMTYTKYEAPVKTFVHHAPPRQVSPTPIAPEKVYIETKPVEKIYYESKPDTIFITPTKVPVRETYTYVREVPQQHGIPGSISCGKCRRDLPMNGTYVTANGQSFHHECFSCETCNKPIQDMKYKLSNGKVQCVSCSSPNCDACGKAVEGRQLTAEGRTYHPECFRCNKCDHPLRGEYAINPKNGDRVCLKCDAPQCSSCRRTISEGESYHQAKDNTVRCVPCARSVAGPGPNPHGAPQMHERPGGYWRPMPAPMYGQGPPMARAGPPRRMESMGPPGYYGGARGNLGPPQGPQRKIPRPYDYAGYGGPAYAAPRKWVDGY